MILTKYVFLGLGGALAIAAGCSTLLGADFDRAATLPDASEPDAAAEAATRDPRADVEAGAAADARTPPDCPGTAGPPGVRIHAEAGTWCIDSTEVTRAQYGIFVASTDVGALPEPAFCAWNKSFLPYDGWKDLPHDDRPVTKVNWCDAYMYCAWAGKRLCGEHTESVVCGSADENATVVLSCPKDQVVVSVDFASFGNPSGSCGAFAKGTCDASGAWKAVTDACLEKSTCTVRAAADVLGDGCFGQKKTLRLQAACASEPAAATRTTSGAPRAPSTTRMSSRTARSTIPRAATARTSGTEVSNPSSRSPAARAPTRGSST